MNTSPDIQPAPSPARMRWRAWRRSRPLIGGLLVCLGGIEMFFSGQLDVGRIHIQLGIEGFQATVIPIALVLLGILIISMPAHRIFYGVIALAVAVYSLVGVNLGGFFIGMLLATTGGIIAVSWAPKTERADDGGDTGSAGDTGDAAGTGETADVRDAADTDGTRVANADTDTERSAEEAEGAASGVAR